MTKKYFVILGLLIFSFPFLFANSQVEFLAAVTSIVSEDDDVVLLEMALTPEFVIPVRVTEETEIRGENDETLEVEDLMTGMILKVEGLFTSEGIFAEELVVVADGSGFRVTGTIQDIIERSIVISDFPITVAEDAGISDSEDAVLGFEDLEVGQRVRTSGDIVEGTFLASRVRVRPFEGRISRIRFEGIVDSIDGDDILVIIEGVGPALVRITEDTKIRGNLAVGVSVRVVGFIEPDLTVRASKIVAKPLLKVAPDHLKMKFEQTRRVEVILRESLEEDVVLTITSRQPEIATPSVDTLTVPASKITAAFEVTSNNQEGETVVDVVLPDSLGGQVATVEVEVQDRGDERDEDLKISWRPDEVSMKSDKTRKVHLVLRRPAATALTVELSLKSGPEGLVDFPSIVAFEEGDRHVKVEIQALGETGEVKIRATLPEEFGGDDDDLEVEIREPRGHDGDKNDDDRDEGEDRDNQDGDEEELEIRWEPDEFESRFNETRTLRLTLNEPAPREFVAELSVKEGPADAVEFPREVVFAEGDRSVDVEISTRESEGRVKIRAALPFDVGSDTDDLEIEIVN